jgi:hypothetical protein
MTPAQYNEYQRQADVIEQEKKWKEEQEKKMTSIEWLEEKAKEFAIDLDLLNYFEQAKEMHKQEIIEAYCNGNDLMGAEQYYQETFKNKLK